MKKYEHLIHYGIKQPLETVPLHHAAPLTRYVLFEKEQMEGDGGFKVVTHIISDLPAVVPPYCSLHWHDFDEVNLILSEDSSLRYRFQLGEEYYEVQSPATVHIPKGLRHSAEALSGRGVFVAMAFTKNYQAHQ